MFPRHEWERRPERNMIGRDKEDIVLKRVRAGLRNWACPGYFSLFPEIQIHFVQFIKKKNKGKNTPLTQTGTAHSWRHRIAMSSLPSYHKLGFMQSSNRTYYFTDIHKNDYHSSSGKGLRSLLCGGVFFINSANSTLAVYFSSLEQSGQIKT